MLVTAKAQITFELDDLDRECFKDPQVAAEYAFRTLWHSVNSSRVKNADLIVTETDAPEEWPEVVP